MCKSWMYLRAYKRDDRENFYQLDMVCFAPRFRFSRRAMRRFAESRDALVHVACEQAPDGSERVLGFVIVHVQRHGTALAGYVVTLDVAPEARRAGLGRALVQAVEDESSRAGASFVWLYVFVGNEAAMRLYQRLGYERVVSVSGFYGAGADAWVYRKPLPGETPASRSMPEGRPEPAAP